MKTLVSIALIFSLVPGLVIAEHKIHFSVTEQVLAENDLLIVQMIAQHQAKDPQSVTEKINQQMQAAWEALERKYHRYAKTENYSIRPSYNKQGVIIGWQGQQQLTLTLQQSLDIARILHQLEPHLIYQSMRADISGSKRKQLESSLMQLAIQSYQQKAALIAKAFANSNYQLRETHIHTSSPLIRPQARMMANSEAMPTIEMGQQTLQLEIRGVLVMGSSTNKPEVEADLTQSTDG